MAFSLEFGESNNVCRMCTEDLSEVTEYYIIEDELRSLLLDLTEILVSDCKSFYFLQIPAKTFTIIALILDQRQQQSDVHELLRHSQQLQ